MRTVIEAREPVMAEGQRPEALERSADASARGGRRRLHAVGAAVLAAGGLAAAVVIARHLEVRPAPAAPRPPRSASLGFRDRLQPPAAPVTPDAISGAGGEGLLTPGPAPAPAPAPALP